MALRLCRDRFDGPALARDLADLSIRQTSSKLWSSYPIPHLDSSGKAGVWCTHHQQASMGLCYWQRTHRWSVVVLSFLPSPISQSKLRTRSPLAVLVSRHGLPGLVGGLYIRWSTLGAVHETRIICERRSQTCDAHHGDKRNPDYPGAISWHDFSQQSM